MSLKQVVLHICKSFMSILPMFFLLSCKLSNTESVGDDWYYVRIKNNTQDTLLLIVEEDTIADTLLLPSSAWRYYDGIGACKSEDAVNDVLFARSARLLEGKAKVYRNNTLLIEWSAPAREMGDTNHFYNYNSWKKLSSKETDEGVIQFSINDSDLRK